MSHMTCLVDHPALAGTQGPSPPAAQHFSHKERRPNPELRRRWARACGCHTDVSTELPSTQLWIATSPTGRGVKGPRFTSSSWAPTAHSSLATGGRDAQISTFCEKIRQMTTKGLFSFTALKSRGKEGRLLSTWLGRSSWFSVPPKMVRKVLCIGGESSSGLEEFSSGAGAVRKWEQQEGDPWWRPTPSGMAWL